MTTGIARASVCLSYEPDNFQRLPLYFFHLFSPCGIYKCPKSTKVIVSVSMIFDVRLESQQMLGLRPNSRTAWDNKQFMTPCAQLYLPPPPLYLSNLDQRVCSNFSNNCFLSLLPISLCRHSWSSVRLIAILRCWVFLALTLLCCRLSS